MADKELIYSIKLEGTELSNEKTTSLSKAIKELTDEKKELNKQIKELDKNSSTYDEELGKLLNTQNEVNAKLKIAKKEYASNEKAVISNTKATRAETGSLEQLRGKLSILTAQYDKLSKEQRENAEVGGVQLKRIKELNKEISDIEENSGRFQRGVGNYSKAFKGLGAAVKTATGAFLAIQGIIQTFSFFKDFANKVGESNKLLAEFTDGTGESVKQLSNLSLAISQTFGQDQKEVLIAANSLSKQMGISFEEALNKINLGFSAGLNNNGEFLSQLREYPTLLSEVGLTADETFNLINQTVKSGVYSDKGIDSIKEAGIALRELTPVTRQALDGIGLSSAEIERSLADGSKSVLDVIKEVSTQMGTLPPQSAVVGTAIADIFKGAGEDAGLDFLLTLKDINSEFSEQTLNLNEAQLAQLELAKSNEKLNAVFNKYFGDSSIGFQKIKAFAISFLADGLNKLIKANIKVANGFITIYNSSLPLRYSLSAIISLIKSVQKFGEYLFTQHLRFYKDVSDIFNSLINLDFDNIALISEKYVKDQIEAAKKLGSDIYDTFADGFEETKNKRLPIIEFKTEEVKTESGKEAEEKARKEREAEAKKEAERLAKQKEAEAKKEAERLAKQKEADAKKEAERLKKQTEDNVKSVNKTIEELEKEALLRGIDDKYDAEIKKLEIARDIRKKEISESLADKKQKDEAELLLDAEFEAKKQEVEAKRQKELDEKEKAQKQAVREQSLNSAKELADTALQVFEDRSTRKKEVELSNLNSQLEQGLISQEEFEKSREAIERKAFNQKKQQDTGQAIINGALAVTRALATSGLLGLLQAGTITATTVAQIGIIQAQKFKKGGVLSGASHEAGGVPMSVDGKLGYEGEGGEAVINKRSTSMFLPQLDAINRAGGGVSLMSPNMSNLSMFRNGGVMSASNVSNSINAEQVASIVSASIGKIQVVNNATDTANVNGRVNQIKNLSTF